jgi:hypothetical protein
MGNTAMISWVMHVAPTVEMRYTFACVRAWALIFTEIFARPRSRNKYGFKYLDGKSRQASEQSTAEGSSFS